MASAVYRPPFCLLVAALYFLLCSCNVAALAEPTSVGTEWVSEFNQILPGGSWKQSALAVWVTPVESPSSQPNNSFQAYLLRAKLQTSDGCGAWTEIVYFPGVCKDYANVEGQFVPEDELAALRQREDKMVRIGGLKLCEAMMILLIPPLGLIWAGATKNSLADAQYELNDTKAQLKSTKKTKTIQRQRLNFREIMSFLFVPPLGLLWAMKTKYSLAETQCELDDVKAQLQSTKESGKPLKQQELDDVTNTNN